MQRTKATIIRDFILSQIRSHPSDISALVAREFGISRQASSRHVRNLVKGGILKISGSGRRVKYELKELEHQRYDFDLGTQLEEDIVWATYVKPIVSSFANVNSIEILNYGFTEMLNNVLDHSGGSRVTIDITVYADKSNIRVNDNGIGIFKKIQDYFGFEDPRHSLLELAKGKLTSDPERHTGEGIFFASRIMDKFIIWSHFLSYIRYGDQDWLFEDRDIKWNGTFISMEMNHNTNKTTKEIFEKYAGEANDYGFTRTHVPVNLSLYEGETLVSRSQAKRLLARVDRFSEVWLDFKDVKSIGPAFADEIFRVFAKAHPNIRLFWENANPVIEKMIARAIGAGDSPSTI